MLEAIQAISLLGLIVGHYYLIRGCFGIRQAIPEQGSAISTRIDRTADLLDEVAQLMADLLDGQAPPPPAIAQTGSPIADLLTTFLMRQSTPAPPHGTTSEEWEIYPTDPNQTTNPKEYQPNDGGSAIPNR